MVAAGREFAEFGLAGARVDRIAAAANASKERLYAYFGDKRALFVAVLTAHMAEVTASMPLDSDDLAGYVGHLFDFAHGHPEHFRMMDWARLGGDVDLLPAIPEGVVERDAAAIREAQARGLVDPGWEPGELFALLFAVAITQAATPLREDGRDVTVARRRDVAVRAAAKLIAP